MEDSDNVNHSKSSGQINVATKNMSKIVNLGVSRYATTFFFVMHYLIGLQRGSCAAAFFLGSKNVVRPILKSILKRLIHSIGRIDNLRLLHAWLILFCFCFEG